MKTHRLPNTDSVEELAKFWDTHDLTDFQDELVDVDEPVFERETSITLRLSTMEAKAVRDMAKSKGLADEELIREWVLERIHAT
jgi:predicted DNA binding CopG/RHH family protein